jgi:hypothetical protein
MGQIKSNEDIKIVSALNLATAANTDRNGATLDTNGYQGVLMFVKFGAIAADATTSIKAQQGAVSDLSDAADLAGTGITVAHDDDNQIFCIDLYRPAERYVRVVVDKDGTTSNASQEMAWYVLYGPTYRPQVNSVTDLVTVERHMTPAEGTA